MDMMAVSGPAGLVAAQHASQHVHAFGGVLICMEVSANNACNLLPLRQISSQKC